MTLACDISDLYPLSSKVKHVGSLSQPPAIHFQSSVFTSSRLQMSSNVFRASWIEFHLKQKIWIVFERPIFKLQFLHLHGHLKSLHVFRCLQMSSGLHELNSIWNKKKFEWVKIIKDTVSGWGTRGRSGRNLWFLVSTKR